MISYNPKHWVKLLFDFHTTDSFRQLVPAMIGVGIYSIAVVWVERYFEWHFKNPTAIHSILGFVVSMLLVFRTNSAYERWWEGRKIWGSVVNNSRNLFLKLHVILSPKNKPELNDLRVLIGNYVFCMKNHLRDTYISGEFEDISTLSAEALIEVAHKPNRVAMELYKKINALHSQGIISGDQLIVLNEEIRSFTDNCGACERIKSTPIPYSYSNFLKKIIFLFVITLPIMFGTEFKFSTVPITVGVLYVFASLELIAEEIEDPFGYDDNDLPLSEICGKIKANLKEISEQS